MGDGIKSIRLRVSGMTCANCQSRIENKLRRAAGVQSASVSYSAGTAEVVYDENLAAPGDIAAAVRELGYGAETDAGSEPPGARARQAAGALIVLLALFMTLRHLGWTDVFNLFPTVETGMSYGMLFVAGLLTSLHCVAMCGGINLSQCLPRPDGAGASALRPAFLYNFGRVAAYTAVGFLVGGLGAAFTFSPGAQGGLKLAAGVFMIVMGLNLLGLFPWLRRFTPRLPRVFARAIEARKTRDSGPLVVGLLNGLMPCGPLQAMQLYALSTGSPAEGALSMLVFALGTAPLMFGLGALSSALSQKFTRRAMTVGAALVVLLGMGIFSQGWTLAALASPAPFRAETASAAGLTVTGGVQVINSTLQSGRYPAITVLAGTPVRWIIDAPAGSINGCNNRMRIPEYGIQHQFQTGENIIEFTPERTGRFTYSCWMGMIRSTVTVVAGDGEEAGATGAGSGEAASAAGVTINTDKITAADIIITEDGGRRQRIEMEISDSGFSPAVVVLEAGVETEWLIINTSARPGNEALLFPAYSARLPLTAGENPVSLFPTGSFDFSVADNAFYGYVKVVDDLAAADIQAVKTEAENWRPLIWPEQTFAPDQGGGCC
ncbi:MAG: sulfite exporter TauE/SafE family protein [Gracilibacteraceae bacterium]|jgi:sulfite exporter TauE/SafE/copper chaperone CopZ/plastocyanin domain-containing protein|nr:sulfite exporter TauE/SafE family protein [Gracilibacteraceae bacterium]